MEATPQALFLRLLTIWKDQSTYQKSWIFAVLIVTRYGSRGMHYLTGCVSHTLPQHSVSARSAVALLQAHHQPRMPQVMIRSF